MIPTLRDDFEGFKTPAEKVTADVVQVAGDRDQIAAISWCNSSAHEEQPLVVERREWFPEMGSTPGDDAVTTIETTTKDVDYDTN